MRWLRRKRRGAVILTDTSGARPNVVISTTLPLTMENEAELRRTIERVTEAITETEAIMIRTLVSTLSVYHFVPGDIVIFHYPGVLRPEAARVIVESWKRVCKLAGINSPPIGIILEEGMRVGVLSWEQLEELKKKAV